MILSPEIQRRTAFAFLISLIAGLVLAVLAPFNTHNFTLLERILYWMGLCVAGCIGACLYEIVTDFSGKIPKQWHLILGQTIGATAAVSLFIIGPNTDVGFKAIILTIFNIGVVALVISTVGVLIRSRSGPVDPATEPEIFARLPVKLRESDIYAVRSEDHYVRVYTSKGETMILMRLSDAIKECKPLKGIQTHRSWWVAEAGIETLKRSEGKTILALKNEIVVPVSRRGHGFIKAEGWL